MDGFWVEFVWLLAALFIGVCIGSLTGLIPGFHVNNVALIALSMSPLAVNAGIPCLRLQPLSSPWERCILS